MRRGRRLERDRDQVRIALVERAPPTDFEVGTRRFGLLIMRTVVGLVLFVFLVNALLRRDPLEAVAAEWSAQHAIAVKWDARTLKQFEQTPYVTGRGELQPV